MENFSITEIQEKRITRVALKDILSKNLVIEKVSRAFIECKSTHILPVKLITFLYWKRCSNLIVNESVETFSIDLVRIFLIFLLQAPRERMVGKSDIHLKISE